MDYYKTFYSSNVHRENVNDFASAFSENITPLDEMDKLSWEGKVSSEECLRALHDFNNEKLQLEMINSFNFAFDSGTLSISQRRGIITFIPKPNKDITSLENLTPISLLNVDYKILTKTIAKRSEKVLPKIICPNQNGYVKNRHIGKNVRLILVIMSYTEENKLPVAALFIDFRKAFGSVEWSFLIDTLNEFNFWT